ncbi:MAG: 6,7-dimethyl-8-ribityllumazine synthase [Sphingobacteriia bacterium]|jgi:6,7-dimethyl-8-ribityllumazine synthase|nr:MAG: 6,7-dimethyl-8-ribityllumazine synthase [Sphingobacteriia bacterium]TAG32224.1 MAG: 6,7-dimethyl-8-ribityllumazine synthase [Sphingobacteriia bacterium]
MATKGNINLYEGIPDMEDAFVVIVKTEWNSAIVNALAKAARQVLKAKGVGCKVITVPGAFEIPFAVKNHYAYCKRMPDAYITLGAIIQGDTPHFDYVCKAVTDGVLQLNLSIDSPVIFGVLTVLTEVQAKERIGGIHGNKGEEAAITALKMIALNRSFK